MRWIGFAALVLLFAGVLPASTSDYKVGMQAVNSNASDRIQNTKYLEYLDGRLLPGFESSRSQADCSNVGQGGCGGYNSDTGQNCPCDMRPITSNCGGERTISCGYDDYCKKTNCGK